MLNIITYYIIVITHYADITQGQAYRCLSLRAQGQGGCKVYYYYGKVVRRLREVYTQLRWPWLLLSLLLAG